MNWTCTVNSFVHFMFMQYTYPAKWCANTVEHGHPWNPNYAKFFKTIVKTALSFRDSYATMGFRGNDAYLF